ncbi:helix-turn-helix domain-containing protein [Candidatus Woesearchaeota archaeon]|nr:helix-turn-helix domain-containing protein [Candidatus Woesearchaeota archaeon]
MIKEKLHKIGLTKGESEIYELLIESGETKAGAIIKRSNLASSKVYDVLQKLLNKGLASFIEKEGVRHYQATPPERLVDFLEEKKIEIQDAQQEMVALISVIKAKQANKSEHSNVRMYLGNQGPQIVLKELAEGSKETGYNYGYGTQENPFVQFFPHDLKAFFDAEKKHKLKTLLIFAQGHRQQQPHAEIRYLPSEFIAPVRTMIAGSKVFLVDFTKPFTTIILENRQIAQSYIDHFMFLWKIAKK